MNAWLSLGRSSAESDAFRRFLWAAECTATRQLENDARRNGWICRASVRDGNAIGPCGRILPNGEACVLHEYKPINSPHVS